MELGTFFICLGVLVCLAGFCMWLLDETTYWQDTNIYTRWDDHE